MPIMCVVACDDDGPIDQRLDLGSLSFGQFNINRSVTKTNEDLKWPILAGIENISNVNVQISDFDITVKDNHDWIHDDSIFDVSIQARESSSVLRGSTTVKVNPNLNKVDISQINQLTFAKDYNVKIGNSQDDYYASGYYPSEQLSDVEAFQNDFDKSLKTYINTIPNTDASNVTFTFNWDNKDDFKKPGAIVKGSVKVDSDPDGILEDSVLHFRFTNYAPLDLTPILTNHFEGNDPVNTFENTAMFNNCPDAMIPKSDTAFSQKTAGTIYHDITSAENYSIPPEYQSYFSSKSINLFSQYNFSEPDQNGYYTFQDDQIKSPGVILLELTPLTNEDKTNQVNKDWNNKCTIDENEISIAITATIDQQQYGQDFILTNDEKQIIFKYYFPTI